MLFYIILVVVVLVPVTAYWINWRSEARVRHARLDAIQKRLDEIAKGAASE